MRLINIEAVLKAAELAGKKYVSIDFLKDFEQIDAVPVVRGEWIVDECDTSDDVPSYSWINFHCSECNTNYGLEEGQYSWCRYEKIPYNYCPNCGAKMVGHRGGKDES